jgi:diamine N-acetyltransferase
MVTLKEVTVNNFWDVVELKACDIQTDYAADNLLAIALSKVRPECVPLAIYNGEIPVGFLLYCVDRKCNEYHICHFMIDRKFQRKGYGKLALSLLLSEIKKDKNCRKIITDVEMGNVQAISFYKSFGFKFNGDVQDGSYFMELHY